MCNFFDLRSKNDEGDDSSRIKSLCWFGNRCFRQNCKFSHEGSSVALYPPNVVLVCVVEEVIVCFGTWMIAKTEKVAMI